MSNQNSNPPIDTIRDGAISAKVWRNHTKENEPFYSVTFQRTYTDSRTNAPRDSASFQGTDILKVQELASRAYQSVNRFREADRQQDQGRDTAPDQQREPQQNDMAAARDAAMQNAPAPEQGQQPARPRER